MTTGTGAPVNEMNVTPLIDILLVLLIVFMVITPLTPRGLDASIPQQNRSETQAQSLRTVVIELAGGPGVPTIEINGESVSLAALQTKLTSIFATRAERVAFVKADSGLDFEQVAEVIDVAHAAGIDKVA